MDILKLIEIAAYFTFAIGMLCLLLAPIIGKINKDFSFFTIGFLCFIASGFAYLYCMMH